MELSARPGSAVPAVANPGGNCWLALYTGSASTGSVFGSALGSAASAVQRPSRILTSAIMKQPMMRKWIFFRTQLSGTARRTRCYEVRAGMSPENWCLNLTSLSIQAFNFPSVAVSSIRLHELSGAFYWCLRVACGEDFEANAIRGKQPFNRMCETRRNLAGISANLHDHVLETLIVRPSDGASVSLVRLTLFRRARRRDFSVANLVGERGVMVACDPQAFKLLVQCCDLSLPDFFHREPRLKHMIRWRKQAEYFVCAVWRRNQAIIGT